MALDLRTPGAVPAPAPPPPVQGEDQASFLGQVTYSWVNTLFTKANTKDLTLTEQDLLPLRSMDSPSAVSERFEELLKKHTAAKAANPVTSALWEQFRAPMIAAGWLKFTNSTLNLAPPVILNFLLRWLAAKQANPDGSPAWVGYVWALGLFFSFFFRTFVENAYFHRVVRVGYQIRTCLTTTVYRKALRLSPVARQETPTGQVVNLMQLDATRVDQMMMQLHVLWDGMYQIITNMILLGIYIGPAALAGLASMVLLIPLNFMGMMKMAGLRRAIVKENDQRIKVMNEVLQGIRAVKLYAWETFFTAKVLRVRDAELLAVRGYAVQNSINSTLMQTAPVVVAVVTLLVFAATGGPFTAAAVFTALAVLNQLRFPLMFYPMAISQLADCRVSLERLKTFMEQPEVPGEGEGGAGGAGGGVAGSAAAAAAATAAAPAAPAATALPIDAAAIPAVAPTYYTPSALAALAAPPSASALRMSSGTFFWEEPATRLARLTRKAAEDRKAAEAKGKKGAAEAAAKAKAAGGTPGAGAAAAAATAAAAASAALAAAPPPPIAPAAPALTSVTFAIPKGELWAVVGSVGVGKSALVGALMKELAAAPGAQWGVSGRVAYTAQTPWVLNATLKANIVFVGDAHAGGGGQARTGGGGGSAAALALADGGAGAARAAHSCKDEAFYRAVLSACALEADLAALPAGDATEIGERGINLSGGQKARVSLARAAYARADVCVLDDPLSALDAEVGRSVFERVIGPGGLMAGSGSGTRLLITNALQYLPACAGVLMLVPGPEGTGRLAAAGSYDSLMQHCAEFRALVEAYKGVSSGGAGEAAGAEAAAAAAAAAGVPAAAAAATGAAAPPPAAAAATALTIATKPPAAAGKAAAAAGASATLMSEEEKREGAVATEYYLRYLRAGGSLWVIVPVIGVAYILMQLAQTVNQWWLTYWSSDSAGYALNSAGFYMGVYAALGVASCVFAFIRLIATSLVGISASRRLHETLLLAVVRAPMAFFDTTPVGRLISRFTKDMDAIDMTLPSSMGMLGTCVMWVLGCLGAIIFAVPWFALVCLPVLLVYLQVMTYFRAVSREVKRFDSITRSPIYAHFSETLGGLSTIRAYGMSAIFSAANEARVADNIQAWYNLRACDRWLGVRLETLGNVVVLSSALLCVGTTVGSGNRSLGTTDGLTGFALSFAMAVTGMLTWLVRTAAECEQQMTSVERVTHYLDNTPGEPYEASASGGAPPPPPAWPASGALAFEKFRMRYRAETPEVLHGISFAVRAGERVGIVGRTGSGKSSIMAALFRLIEERCMSGVVRLDGVDTGSVGLARLRPSLAIIPQDPTVFSGTLRSNLDPTEALGSGAAADARLWAALEQVSLKAWAQRLDRGLDSPVTEFGESMSVGQRQLVCLCRVLLRADRISVLALDEASASLDHVSDAALQGVVKAAFGRATIVCVAHRLHTIIDYDRILVLDAGEVAEFDTPAALLARPGSHFCRLVEELGPQVAGELRAQAAASARGNAARWAAVEGQ